MSHEKEPNENHFIRLKSIVTDHFSDLSISPLSGDPLGTLDSSLFETEIHVQNEPLHSINIREKTGSEQNRLIITRDKLNEFMSSHSYSPSGLIDLFSEDFGEIYAKDAGVWEGYTIGEHSKMAIEQFDHYFGYIQLPAGVSGTLFRCILVLHDIGKPQAIAAGDNTLQFDYTLPIMDATLEYLEFSEGERSIARTLVNGDFIGDTFKTRNIHQNAKNIVNASMSSGLSAEDFFSLLTIYYKVDAGSYTEDAGGRYSLDDLFSFDRNNRNLTFAPKQQELFNTLYKAVKEMATTPYEQSQPSEKVKIRSKYTTDLKIAAHVLNMILKKKISPIQLGKFFFHQKMKRLKRS